MRTVTVAVVGGETTEVSVDADATYADLLAAVDLRPHEATALVDGRPVPEDAPVAADEVRVLRLVRGGSADGSGDGRGSDGGSADEKGTDDGSDGDGDDGSGDGRRSTDATIRRATTDDVVAVLRVVEGALLEVDADRVRGRVAAGEALVAERDGRVVGALVRDGDRVLAVAVRRRHRRRGIGAALVGRALAAAGRLTAAFDPRVRGFYESLGFAVDGDADADGRLRGVRTAE